MEAVPLHGVPCAVLHVQPDIAIDGVNHVEVAEAHAGVVGGRQLHADIVAGEVAVVEGDGIAGMAVGGVHGRVKAAERTTRHGIVAVGVADAWVEVRHLWAHPLGDEARLLGINGLAAVVGRLVAEGAAVELHAPHVPHRDMAVETGAILSEQVVAVHCEGAAGEVGGVVGYGAAGGVVLVGEECHGAAVVAEQGVGGLDDAAGMLEHGIRVRPHGADGIAGVLDGGVVEDDAALCEGGLPDVGVALHDDALPHLAVARIGKHAAVHDKLPAGTDDDAARIIHVYGSCQVKCL